MEKNCCKAASFSPFTPGVTHLGNVDDSGPLPVPPPDPALTALSAIRYCNESYPSHFVKLVNVVVEVVIVRRFVKSPSRRGGRYRSAPMSGTKPTSDILVQGWLDVNNT